MWLVNSMTVIPETKDSDYSDDSERNTESVFDQYETSEDTLKMLKMGPFSLIYSG
jgi:hypothetical protein